jgi:hypothetical protein
MRASQLIPEQITKKLLQHLKMGNTQGTHTLTVSLAGC